MKYNLNNLYCNIDIPRCGRIFNLPDDIFTDKDEAEQEQIFGQQTLTLRLTFDRIAKDIHEDA